MIQNYVFRTAKKQLKKHTHQCCSNLNGLRIAVEQWIVYYSVHIGTHIKTARPYVVLGRKRGMVAITLILKLSTRRSRGYNMISSVAASSTDMYSRVERVVYVVRVIGAVLCAMQSMSVCTGIASYLSISSLF